MKEQRQISVTCEMCGIQITKPSLKDHIKSQRHLKNLEFQNTPKVQCVAETKTCRVCGKEKLLARFRPKHATCRDCNNSKKIAYRQTEEGHKHIREIEQKRDGIKMTCECGAIVHKKHIARHRETNKHFERTQTR